MSSQVAPGTRVAGFYVEAQIGHGAMAEVYRARAETGHIVALKLLDSSAGRALPSALPARVGDRRAASTIRTS